VIFGAGAAVLLFMGVRFFTVAPRRGPMWMNAVPFVLVALLALTHGSALRRILRQRLTSDGIEIVDRPGEFIIRWSEVTGVDVSDSGLLLEGAGERTAIIDLSYVGHGRRIRECVLGYVPVESLRRLPG
jgi:hypothetical protein